MKFADCNWGLKEGQSTGLSIQCVVVSCLRAPWGGPHPAWRTAKGLLRPPYVFLRRIHRDGAADTARGGWVTRSPYALPLVVSEPLGEPQLKKETLGVDEVGVLLNDVITSPALSLPTLHCTCTALSAHQRG